MCSQGKTICSEGRFQCKGDLDAAAQSQQPEICNNLDDDCDGILDESPSDVGGGCESDGQGVCSQGIERCILGAKACRPLNEAQNELCDGLDNGCDGRLDEGYPVPVKIVKRDRSGVQSG